MIRVTAKIAIDEKDIALDFIRSSGPGGQNVNKVSTAVQLRFDTRNLPAGVRTRLRRLAGRRMTSDGVVVIQAQRLRSQEQNRRDALERLIALIRRAAVRPRRRIKTLPSRASRERRLAAKRHRSRIKQHRGSRDVCAE